MKTPWLLTFRNSGKVSVQVTVFNFKLSVEPANLSLSRQNVSRLTSVGPRPISWLDKIGFPVELGALAQTTGGHFS